MLAGADRRRRPRPSPRLLRRRRRRSPTRERAAVRAPCPSTKPTFSEQLGVDAPGRRGGLHARSSAAGPGRRSTSTASPAATRAKAPRRCCPRGPARSSASAWCRTRTPHKIADRLRKQFLEARCPPGIRMELVDHHGAPGVVMPLDSPYLQPPPAAIETGFGQPPGLHPRRRLDPDRQHLRPTSSDADVLLLGWGQNDDNTHSPNEKFSLADFHRGISAQRTPVARTRQTPRLESVPELRHLHSTSPPHARQALHSRKRRRRPAELRPPRREGRRRALRRARDAAPHAAAGGRGALAAGQRREQVDRPGQERRRARGAQGRRPPAPRSEGRQAGRASTASPPRPAPSTAACRT